MKRLRFKEVNDFVNKNIERFHESKIRSLEQLNLKSILRKKNPYLFKAKSITLASELVREILESFLYASEEKLFGDFLEDLAIFISSKTSDGRKSSATGIDFEFVRADVHYLVSIKSGPSWGNSSQQKKQEENFKTAVRVLKQSRHALNIQPVLGICYGKTKTSFPRGYQKVVGQNFWYLISGNKNTYTDIIEPLGYRAREHNDEFIRQKNKVLNIFTQEFMSEYCKDGQIDWRRLVEFNSGNLDLIK